MEGTSHYHPLWPISVIANLQSQKESVWGPKVISVEVRFPFFLGPLQCNSSVFFFEVKKLIDKERKVVEGLVNLGRMIKLEKGRP